MFGLGVLVRSLLVIIGTCLFLFTQPAPLQAATIDAYVQRYLDVSQPVPINIDSQGNTKNFSAIDLSEGKRLFEKHCLNCHVGGSTLQLPSVSLSLEDLHGTSPERDNINGLVAYMRNPMVYDNSEENYWCRKVPDTWLPQEQVEQLAAFVIRAAQKAPGWGAESFD